MSIADKIFEKLADERSGTITLSFTAEDVEWLEAASLAMRERFQFQVWDYDADSEDWETHTSYPTKGEAVAKMVEYGATRPTIALRVWDKIMQEQVADKAPEAPKPRFADLWDLYNGSWISMEQYRYLKDVDAEEAMVSRANTMGGGDFQKWVLKYIERRREFYKEIRDAGKRAFCDQARELIDNGQLSLMNAMVLADLPIEKQDPETLALACTLNAKSFATFVKGVLASQ